MQYKRVPRYRLVVKGQPFIYLGRKPSAMDYIKNNCRDTYIKLFEQVAMDEPEVLVYEAWINEDGVPVKYTGYETERKKD